MVENNGAGIQGDGWPPCAKGIVTRPLQQTATPEHRNPRAFTQVVSSRVTIYLDARSYGVMLPPISPSLR